MPPTANSFAAGIDVVTRDANGITTPLVGESINIRYLGGADILTVTTAADGFIEGQSLPSVESETLVEFYSATKTGVLRMSTARTLESAYSVEVTLILDDAFIDSKTSGMADLYLRNKQFPNVALTFLGTQKKGSTADYPLEFAKATDVDIIAQSRTDKFEFGTIQVENASFASLTIGGIYDLWHSRYSSIFTIDLNTTSVQTVCTIPAGNNYILTRGFFSNASESLIASAESVSILDRNGASILDQPLADFDSPAADKRSTLAQSAIYRPGDDVQVQVSGAYGSASSLDLRLNGFLRDAG